MNINNFMEHDGNSGYGEDKHQSVLTKMSNFFQMHNISIGDFWKTNRNYVSVADLFKFCEMCGLELGAYDQISMKTELFKKKDVLSSYEFCECIPYWKHDNSREVVTNFLRERTEQVVQ